MLTRTFVSVTLVLTLAALATVADLEKIAFVMKGGAVICDDARAAAQPQS